MLLSILQATSQPPPPPTKKNDLDYNANGEEVAKSPSGVPGHCLLIHSQDPSVRGHQCRQEGGCVGKL